MVDTCSYIHTTLQSRGAGGPQTLGEEKSDWCHCPGPSLWGHSAPPEEDEDSGLPGPWASGLHNRMGSNFRFSRWNPHGPRHSSSAF